MNANQKSGGIGGDAADENSTAEERANAMAANDGEAPPIPPHDAANSADAGQLDVDNRDGDNNASEGEIGDIETIEDYEAPIHPSTFEVEREKQPKAEGGLEQDLDSDPHRDSLAALEQDDSLLKGPKEPASGWSPRSLLGSVAPVLLSPPVPERYAALDDDNSHDLARAKVEILNARQESVCEPKPEDESDAQPTITNPRNRNQEDIRAQTAIIPPANTPVLAPSTTIITADIQATSPYVNERDEICIPEATLVTSERRDSGNEDIPAATVVRPEKYSLTIAGRRIKLHFVVLGVIVILVVVVALAVTLSGGEDNTPSGGGDALDLAPSSAPSVSFLPTSTLQAELMDIILEHSGGNVSSSFADAQSNHRMALNWLVDDQSKWLEEKEPLSNAEVVERFVLALLYLETRGGDWRERLEFMTEEHICKWRGYVSKKGIKYQKGVYRCTDGNARRVTNLRLWDNDLEGNLPSEIGWLTELTALRMELNRIDGTIPSNLGSLTNITHLALNNNGLSGSIDALASMTNLRFVDLSGNKMTGTLMDVSNLTQLESLNVTGNKLSGTVPESYSNIYSLEYLRLGENQLSGNVNFMCNDLPSDFELDCYEDKPEVACSCCFGCTFVNDEECDPQTEKLLTLDIYAGKKSDGFQWELRDEGSWDTIAAGGGYEDGEQINIQMCLTFPGEYFITTSTDAPQPTQPTLSRISFAIDGNNSTILGPNDSEYLYFTANPTVSPRPSSSSSPSAPTPFPTESVGSAKTISPTYGVARATPFPTDTGFDTASPWVTESPTGGATGGATPAVHTNKTISPSWRPTPFPTESVPILETAPPVFSPTPPLPQPSPPAAWDVEDDDDVALDDCGNQLQFELNLTTDDFGMDTSWEVLDKNNGNVVVSDGALASNKTSQEIYCLDPSGCYDFVIKDEWDDGICCEQGKGSYNVSINGRLIGSGGKFGTSETVSLGGNCGLNTTEEGECSENYSLLNVTITTDAWGYETSWEVFDTSTGQIFATNEVSLEDNTNSSMARCIPEQDCYRFTIYDSAGDGGAGWILEFEGDFVDSGDSNFDDFDSTTFGLRCRF